MKKHFSWIITILVTALLIGGCGSGAGGNTDKENSTGESNGSEKGNKKGTITLGYNQWPARIATAHMWKQILENKGYTVKLKAGSKGPLFTGLSEGGVDILSQVWLPNADKPYVQQYEDNIVKHKNWYKKAPLGLVVPKYVNIDSISELKNHEEDFNGKIVGIEPGASLMKLTNKTLKKYNLDYQLIQSSGSAMMSQLKQAYENKKPIVVTLWQPHWAFSVYELKYLRDPKNIYGSMDDIYWFSRTGFKKDFPKVTKYFNQWQMTHEQLSSLINTIRKGEEPSQGAKKWLSQHQDLVKKWTK